MVAPDALYHQLSHVDEAGSQALAKNSGGTMATNKATTIMAGV